MKRQVVGIVHRCHHRIPIDHFEDGMVWIGRKELPEDILVLLECSRLPALALDTLLLLRRHGRVGRGGRPELFCVGQVSD